MAEKEPGTCSILVTTDESHWSWNEAIARELNYKVMKFSRIPMKGEFIRFKSYYYEVTAVYWNGKYGGEAMLEVKPAGCD